MRRSVDDDLEASARSADYQERALAYRAIGQLRFNQKTELLRRGLEDTSPAVRGSALLSWSSCRETHPGLVNSGAGLLHSLATEDGNEAVRRLAVLCLKNGSPQADTLTLLAHLAEEAEGKELAPPQRPCTARLGANSGAIALRVGVGGVRAGAPRSRPPAASVRTWV